jgi:hypothetical protein
MATERISLGGGQQIEGLQETLRAFNRLGREANAAVRNAAKQVAAATATAAQNRAQGVPQQASIAAQSIRPKSDRIPALQAGGGMKVGTTGVAAGAIFFGAEYGGRGRDTTMQFLPHRGQTGYFLWPTIRARQYEDAAIYISALDHLCAIWGLGG